MPESLSYEYQLANLMIGERKHSKKIGFYGTSQKCSLRCTASKKTVLQIYETFKASSLGYKLATFTVRPLKFLY
jgi:hypothetical protein